MLDGEDFSAWHRGLPARSNAPAQAGLVLTLTRKIKGARLDLILIKSNRAWHLNPWKAGAQDNAQHLCVRRKWETGEELARVEGAGACDGSVGVCAGAVNA